MVTTHIRFLDGEIYCFYINEVAETFSEFKEQVRKQISSVKLVESSENLVIIFKGTVMDDTIFLKKRNVFPRTQFLSVMVKQ